jgi:hypothetical protein
MLGLFDSLFGRKQMLLLGYKAHFLVDVNSIYNY